MAVTETQNARVGSEPLLSAHGLSKSYGPVAALGGVSIDFFAGEVHGIVGENGAGKTTLMRLLAGEERPDERPYRDRGPASVALKDPAAAKSHGIVIVHQQFQLVNTMTVAENMCLGAAARAYCVRSLSLVDYGAMTELSRRRLRDFGLDHRVQDRVGDLTVAERQLVEISRAMTDSARILILDEPTASLGAAETREIVQACRGDARPRRGHHPDRAQYRRGAGIVGPHLGVAERQAGDHSGTFRDRLRYDRARDRRARIAARLSEGRGRAWRKCAACRRLSAIEPRRGHADRDRAFGDCRRSDLCRRNGGPGACRSFRIHRQAGTTTNNRGHRYFARVGEEADRGRALPNSGRCRGRRPDPGLFDRGQYSATQSRTLSNPGIRAARQTSRDRQHSDPRTRYPARRSRGAKS